MVGSMSPVPYLIRKEIELMDQAVDYDAQVWLVRLSANGQIHTVCSTNGEYERPPGETFAMAAASLTRIATMVARDPRWEGGMDDALDWVTGKAYERAKHMMPETFVNTRLWGPGEEQEAERQEREESGG